MLQKGEKHHKLTFNAVSAHKTKRSEETASILSSEDCLSLLSFPYASANADRSLSCEAA